uniref:DUF148 domain-containing protein n=1 Tax=Strongyloides venezuelensis TaxID=75913 RepID=A0A0K0F3I5_STRVS
MNSISKSIAFSFLLFGVSFCQSEMPPGLGGDPSGFNGGPGGPGMGGEMGMHHMLPFLMGASQQDIQSFMDIMKNQALTKTEAQTAEDAWASTKNETVQSLYNAFKSNKIAKMQEMKNTINEKTSSLSDSAKQIVNNIQSVMENMSITKADEHSQIKAILDAASEADKESIRSVLPHMEHKMGHGMMGENGMTGPPSSILQN